MKNNKFKVLLLIIILIICILSATYGWFILNEQITSQLETDIRKWEVEFSTYNHSEITNPFIVYVDDLYPGMPEINEKIIIKNNGNIGANLTYEIRSITLFGEKFSLGNDKYSQEELVEILKNCPFKVNIEMDKTLINENENTANFDVTISWEYEDNEDSNKDIKDTEFGTKAYHFLNEHPNEKCFCLEIQLVANQENV